MAPTFNEINEKALQPYMNNQITQQVALDRGIEPIRKFMFKQTHEKELALFVKMLQTGGRCASIVPDGVLFGTSTAHMAIRKELVDNQRLQAVISMPSGVFQPYAGVSTAILVFTKTGAGGTDKVWFYDMHNDGFSLDQKRIKIDDDDRDDVVKRFHNLAGEESRTRKDQSFLVPVEEIRANDYSLSINKYKEIERKVVKYDPSNVIFKRIRKAEDEVLSKLDEFEKMYL